MKLTATKIATLALFALLIVGIFWLFPWLFIQVASWQKAFNQLMSQNLHQIQAHSTQAGIWLIAISFAYGVLHALGPGHGKFIIASYLATHQTQLKASLRLSFLASLMQGVVAIVATSIIVLILRLSSQYFKLSQLWLERTALILLLLLGGYWIWQGISQRKKIPENDRSLAKNSAKFHIYTAQFMPSNEIGSMKIATEIATKKIPQNDRSFCHQHSADCGCGHQHLPSADQLKQATSWKSQFLVILSIGMRPCSGAIFVLFLANMLGVYQWGVVATLAMAFGTGLMLSAFALMVRHARQLASQIGHWYSSPFLHRHASTITKCVAGGLMIFFALSLLYATLQPATGGAALFR